MMSGAVALKLIVVEDGLASNVPHIRKPARTLEHQRREPPYP
jgi:hypothetical protein